jgi:hypothetical protein
VIIKHEGNVMTKKFADKLIKWSNAKPEGKSNLKGEAMAVLWWCCRKILEQFCCVRVVTAQSSHLNGA